MILHRLCSIAFLICCPLIGNLYHHLTQFHSSSLFLLNRSKQPCREAYAYFLNRNTGMYKLLVKSFMLAKSIFVYCSNVGE